MVLKTADSVTRKPKQIFDPVLAFEHHQYLIESYFQSHRIKNNAEATLKKERSFLSKWFVLQGEEHRSLYTWEAMNQSNGRQRILIYADELLKGELHPKTIRGHLGMLRKYFAFVAEFPFIKVDGKMIRVDDYYGVSIAQPISEFDIPCHSYDGLQQGIPFDPEKLHDFYRSVRNCYVRPCEPYSEFRARNYAMLVLAGESGLRADELRNLHIEDLFFESNKIQTRHAKGTRGSGKRSRVSLFTCLAQDSIRHYLKKYRKLFGEDGGLLFPTMSGNPISGQAMRKDLKKMVESARSDSFPVLPHLGWHWMRRIFATRFIERSPDKLSALIKLLGHSSPNTVHRYVQHSEAWIDRQIVETLERLR